LLFPDLFSPTSRSPLGDRFYKQFKPILVAAGVTEAGLGSHAVRHLFGAQLKKKLVVVEDRADLLGHGGDTETSERYCEPHEIAALAMGWLWKHESGLYVKVHTCWRRAVRLTRPRMCNLYSITTNQAAIIALFRVMNRYFGNLLPMPGVFPDYPHTGRAQPDAGPRIQKLTSRLFY
jgi:hypothetical protein